MTLFQENQKYEAMTRIASSIIEDWQGDRHCSKSSQGISLQKPLIEELLKARVTDVVTRIQKG